MNEKILDSEAKSPPHEIKQGNFPYPIPDEGHGESEYLNWLRNHSNYMATRGFLDYMRAVGVLVRGIMINFLAILPGLLLLSVGVALFYEPFFQAKNPIKNLDGDRLVYPGSDTGRKILDEVDNNNLPGSKLPALIEPWTRKSWITGKQELGYSTLKVKVNDGGGKVGIQLPPLTQEAPPSEATLPNQGTILLKGKQLVLVGGENSDDIELTKAKIIGSFEGNGSGELIIRFDPNNATSETITHLVQNITFEKITANAKGEDEIAKRVDAITRKVEGTNVNFEFETDNGAILKARVRVEDSKVAVDEASVAPPPLWKSILDFIGLIVRELGEKPFSLTKGALYFFFVLVLFFPVASRVCRIVGYRKTTETGRSNSVKQRDIVERFFGGGLVALLIGIVIGLLPHLVNGLLRSPLNRETSFLLAIALTIFLLFANKLLSNLGGAKKALMMSLVAFAGLLVPFLVIINTTQFLSYGSGLSWGAWIPLFFIPLVFIGAILITMVVGGLKRSISLSGFFIKLPAIMLGIIVASFLVPVLGTVLFTYSELSSDVSLVTWWEAVQDHGRFIFILTAAFQIWLFCWLALDINATSIHGLYRDRLASAYLVGKNTDKKEVDIEEDINLFEICRYETRSTAPYHLVNVALNLQGSKDPDIRDRHSDFFFFSKKYIGGIRTGYCDTATMDLVHPSMSLATAMAVSAAAASPNMGRGTSPAMVALLTLLNVRLGYWLPNPGIVEQIEGGLVKDDLPKTWRQIKKKRKKERSYVSGIDFAHVFTEELKEIQKRRGNCDFASETVLPAEDAPEMEVLAAAWKSKLVGLGFSGGGIRSATINLGIAQVLHKYGIFDQVDFMSTVSGGGYLGSSISTLMRHRESLFSEIGGDVSVTQENGIQVVTVLQPKSGEKLKEYRFTKDAVLTKKVRGGKVSAGDPLLENSMAPRNNTYWKMFNWRIRPSAFVSEIRSKLDETHKWVNLSDGGHIENLAGIELLRRRCKFIILGDGEADPKLSFKGLATLIRYARIDLNISIDIDVEPISLEEGKDTRSNKHYAVGTITYPGNEKGYLLYLKSSYTGDEDVVIKEYRACNPSFPHQSTADQCFDEGQFEAYHALGKHIAESALREISKTKAIPESFPLSLLEDWIEKLGNPSGDNQSALNTPPKPSEKTHKVATIDKPLPPQPVAGDPVEPLSIPVPPYRPDQPGDST